MEGRNLGCDARRRLVDHAADTLVWTQVHPAYSSRCRPGISFWPFLQCTSVMRVSRVREHKVLAYTESISAFARGHCDLQSSTNLPNNHWASYGMSGSQEKEGHAHISFQGTYKHTDAGVGWRMRLNNLLQGNPSLGTLKYELTATHGHQGPWTATATGMPAPYGNESMVEIHWMCGSQWRGIWSWQGQ